MLQAGCGETTRICNDGDMGAQLEEAGEPDQKGASDVLPFRIVEARLHMCYGATGGTSSLISSPHL